jgi:CHAT domain-containing protein/tetratricopeptide (TPR) repeat protein
MTRAANASATAAACAAAVWLACVTPTSAQKPAPDWASLDQRAASLYAAGDLPHAVDAAQLALRAAVSPRERGKSLDRLGFLHYTSGDLAAGERELRESLQIRLDAFGADSLEYAETANDLAMLLRDLRHMDEARTLAVRSAAIREQQPDASGFLLAESLDTLGTIDGLSGDYSGAATTFERALAIHERRPDSERATEEYGTLCINLAGTYQRLGKYAIAETTFDKGLSALRVKPGTAHPAYAASLVAFAAFEVETGKYVEAERLYDEGVRLLKAELGEQHPFYASMLNNRGALYQAIGNADAAAADYQHSLALKRKLFGPSSSQALSTLRNLAQLTYARDRAAGERLFAEAAESYASVPNPPPFDYASVLLGLGHAQLERHAVDEAGRTIDRALEVGRAGLGIHHPLYAAALRESGLIAAAAGNLAEARRTLDEALRDAIDAHGPAHPDIALFLNALASVDAQMGEFAAAEAEYRRSLAITSRALSDAMAIGSEAFKTESLAHAVDPVPTLIAFQAKAGDRLPEARALAFEAVTSRKGRVLEYVRGWRRTLRNSENAAVAQRAAEWQALLACRTSLSVALGYRTLKPSIVGGCELEGTDLAGKYERLLSDLRTKRTEDVSARAVAAIGTLTGRGDALEATLNRAVGKPSAAPLASVGDISRQLRPDECLIEFVSYAPSTAPNLRRYGAFVLDGHGALAWRDLGDERPIDSVVRDLLNAANDWSASVANHETLAAQASARTAEDAISALSRQIWAPVAPLIAKHGVRRIRVAPDGLLDLVPFDALPDHGPLIQRFTIAYVPAGRDLLPEPPATRPASSPVIMVSPGASGASGSPPSSAASLGTLPSLPEAVREGDDVRRIIRDPQFLGEGQASESGLKHVHGPLLLHIAGHGVIGGDEEPRCDTAPCVSAVVARRSMALTGIVLEEAYGRASGSHEDGLLTAEELQNLDLQGTEMVVLSQCRMAAGVPSVGESVYGMRRAAAIAGVRTFVAPLWNVDDHVQRLLIRRFYSELAAGAGRADALRNAQLAIRRADATRSFLYWAPVILAGGDGPMPASAFRH